MANFNESSYNTANLAVIQISTALTIITAILNIYGYLLIIQAEVFVYEF